MPFKALALFLVLPALVSCGTTGTNLLSQDSQFDDMRQTLQQWSPALNSNNLEPAAQPPDDASLRLHNPAQAQALALRQSPAIRSILASQGIADADYRQATLIQNPGFSASALRAEGSDSWKTEFSLTLGILDWLTLPMRRQLAGAEHAQARSRAFQLLTDELGEVRSVYFAAVAARHISQQHQQTAEAARLNAELAARLSEAGNLSELERLHYEDVSARQRQAWQQAQAEADASMAALKRGLGLDIAAPLEIPDQLPDIADSALSAGALRTLLQDSEQFAMLLTRTTSQRPDVRFLRDNRSALERQLQLQRKQLGMSDIGVGLITEREPDGSRASGFELDLSLLVFDRGQHQRASTRAHQAQLSADEAALELAITYQLQTSLNNLLSLTEQATQLRDEDIPRQQRMLALTLQEYNFMLTGPFELIEAKQQELDTVLRYINTLESYWLEHAWLMQYTANTADIFIASLDSSAPPPGPAMNPTPRAADTHQEHHHD
ncbi:MAG: hypothetical protein CMQ34_09455 [Gammaproteobacteria bacterium]|nr:hypothetical protein [Gammaproteobacteria bacterium]|tara:strand:- start:771 stop:2255 length:1485 start_codon:yes stop_codon:yes gene_type:complete